MSQAPDCRLYILSPEVIEDIDSFTNTLDAMFKAGDVASFQLRLKGASDDEIVAAAKAIMPVCIDHDVALIMNDRADLAKLAGVDGVHLGQGDGSVADARAMLGQNAIIGVTCHDSNHLAFEAGEAGADYVAFGAFFDSPTKNNTSRPELDLLTGWDEATEIPCVAIGGVTVQNCATLSNAGAHFVATCSGVWAYKDGPVQAVKDFNTVLGGK